MKVELTNIKGSWEEVANRARTTRRERINERERI